MVKFFRPFAFAFAPFLLGAGLADAGPFGIFGGRSSGGCSGGSCGGGSSAMMMHASSGSSWGMSAPTMRSAPESIEVGSVHRTLDFYVNAERQRAGLPPVSVDAKMNADLQAAIDADAAAAAFKMTPVAYRANFARGGSTPATVVKAWMADPKLAATILAPEYRTCGYAQAVGSDGKKYWALAMGK
jgi:uncharacterized protein YkwD